MRGKAAMTVNDDEGRGGDPAPSPVLEHVPERTGSFQKAEPCPGAAPPRTLVDMFGGSSEEDRPVLLMPGTRFHGRYRVGPCVGHGGMGHVYEATDERTKGRCALK